MVRNASKYPRRLHLWPKVLVKCLDMSYVTFIPTIVASVLPLPTSRMRKCPIFAENSGFYENIAVRNDQNSHQGVVYGLMLVNCLYIPYATFIPTIVSLVLPLAASRVRKCPILAENSGFLKIWPLEMVRNASKYPRGSIYGQKCL